MSGGSARPLASSGPRAPCCPEPPPLAEPRGTRRSPPPAPRLRSEPGAALSVPARRPGLPRTPRCSLGAARRGSWRGGGRPRFPTPHAGAVTFCRSAASAAGSRGPVSRCRRGRGGQRGPPLPAAGPRSGLSQVAVGRMGERRRWYRAESLRSVGEI